MILYVDMEHDSYLEDPDRRAADYAARMEVGRLFEELSGDACLVQHYTRVSRRRVAEWDPWAVIIGGNTTDWGAYDEAGLAELRALVCEARRPMLGICGGMQLIATTYGAHMAPMRPLRAGEPDPDPTAGAGLYKEWGYVPVRVVGTDPLFAGLGESPCFLEGHYCELKALPAGFDVLASTGECHVQALRRTGTLVYGTQFHPEGYAPAAGRNLGADFVFPQGFPAARTDGRRLLENFFSLAQASWR